MRKVFIICALAGIAVVVWSSLSGGLAYTRDGSASGLQDVSSVFNVPASSSADIVSPVQWHPGPDQREYHSTKYGYIIFYPNTLVPEEFPGESNSAVVTFKDGGQQIGFQIFTIPYPYEKISDDRFHMDLPSGVMKDPVNITINGAAATAFESKNDAMGETWEVWFLHGGYLYEVTAPLPLKEWMLAILETWHFISK